MKKLLIFIWFFTAIVFAEKKQGYVAQVYGPVIKTYYGECVHSFYYDRSTEERPECGGKPPKPKVESAPIPKTIIEVVVLSDASEVLFNFDTAILTLQGNRLLNEITNKIKKYDLTNVKIDGYTDMLGSKEYNLKLAKKRANSVKKFFVSHGVPDNKIIPNGFGDKDAKASPECLAKFNHNDANTHLQLIKCMAPDRKVIITIHHKEKIEKTIMESDITANKIVASSPQ